MLYSFTNQVLAQPDFLEGNTAYQNDLHLLPESSMR